MYHQYFGLTEPAFSIAVNPRYLYMSRQHREALAHLLYGVQGGGFVLLTGEVGTGKTTIIRSLLEQLPENTDIAMVFNPMANVPEMLAMICDELQVDYDRQTVSIKERMDALHRFLLDNHARGRNTVLLIDEAQLLSPETLEQIRLLTNLETHTQKLLQIILVGQPELNTLLAQPRLRQLAQRITARFHLTPLSLAETRAYIQHRLQVAGLGPERSPFSARVIRTIHRLSGGIPRRINILCERLLVGLYAHNQRQVTRRILSQAKQEVLGDLGYNRQSGGRYWIGLLLVAVVLQTLFALYWWKSPGESSATVAEPVLERQAISATTAAPPTARTDTPMASADEPVMMNTLQAAQVRLFDYLEVDAEARAFPCWGENPVLRCETLVLESWQQALEINRPLLLTLTTPEKFTRYVVMVAVAGDEAQLLTAAGDTRKIPLAELGLQWNGRVFYAWRRPPGYTGPIGQGDRGPLVRWLAEQFAVLDNQSTPLTQDVYNRALAERVRLFQQAMGLEDDGIAGQQTLFKLNAALGLDKTLDAGVLSAVEEL